MREFIGRGVIQLVRNELSTPPAWVTIMEDFTVWQVAGNRPLTTQKLRRYHLRRFANETGLAPAEATEENITVWLGVHDWSPSYRHSVKTTLRTFYRWAKRSQRVPENPTTDLPAVALTKPKPKLASVSDLTIGIMHSDERVEIMLRLADRAGLRCIEISRIHARDLLGSNGRFQLVVHGKGGKDRLVPIEDNIARRIKLSSEGGWLFPGNIDGHLSAGYVSKLMSRALPEGVSGHWLRHGAATRWLNSPGSNLRVVQELLGHASVATTEIYTHVEDDQLRRAIAA
jgi:site-specific recombinase XerD